MEHISEFIKSLSAILNDPFLLKKDLIPTILWDKVRNNQSDEMLWRPIVNWDLFENGEQKWGIDEFLSLVKFEKDDQLQILTDCTIQTDEAITYNVSDHNFFEEWYSDKFHEEFFQPLDYIVIKNNQEVVLLHHEGLLMHI